MAYISSLVVTSTPNIVENSLNEWNFTTNDTIPTSEDIYFSVNLNFLNNILTNIGESNISSGNINAGNVYALNIFLCSSIDGSSNFVNVVSTQRINLNSSNLNNNILSAKLTTLFSNFNHTDLCTSMTVDELYQLCKEFKIVFRITSQSSPNITQTIQNGDIVQNFKLVVDVSRSGPYDVTFEYLDILNPNDFNKSELYSIYQSNPNIIGQESQRCFYPKNIRSLTNIPIVLIMHGVGHQSQMYDFYGSLLASYGYFVLQTTTGTGPASSRIYSLIKQLKEQSSKIKSGYFFGKIDFTKIILIGHSFGGTNVLSLSADLQNNIISPSVSGLTFSDIVCGILLEFGSSPGTITDKWTNIPSLTINGSDAIYQNQSNPYALLNCKELQSDPSARDVFRGNIFIRNTRHDEMAHPVSAAQLFTFQPPLPVGNNGITMGYYSTGTGYIKNSNSSVYDYVGQLILKFISMMLKNKIKNIFKTYNNDYKNTIVKNIEYAVAFQYKLPSTDNIYFIDQLTDTTKFTGQTGYFIKETYKTGGNDFNTLLAASIGGSTVYLDYVNPNYNNGNYAFYHYTNTTKGFTYSYNSIPLDLTRSNTAKEINIVMGLVTEASSGGTSDVCITQNNHFSVYLTDNSGNTAMISSKQRNLGIPNANKQYVYSPQDNIQYNMYGYLPATNLVFSLQDFKNKNNLIDLTNISKIQLLFGSTYGTQLLKNELFVYNGMYLTGDT